MTHDFSGGSPRPGKPLSLGPWRWLVPLPVTPEGVSSKVVVQVLISALDPALSWPFQMLVVFKSAPILKRALKVKQAMMQLYVLKLLKVQTKYLGRQWRKSNMKTMSAIYQKVRHRLNDDWAYGNGKALARS